MQKRYILIIACATAILIGTAAAVSATVPRLAVPPTVAPTQGTSVPLSRPTEPAAIIQGAPAIHPSNPTTDPSTPAFTEAEVRAYVAAHPHPDQVSSAPPATIERVEFLPSQEVEARLKDSTGVPKGTLLCLVTLRGSFAVSPPGGGGVKASVGYLVFDAHTGNRLIEGIGPG